jgi:hypothetical protein
VSKGATASVSLTGTGQFLGTPDYVPEYSAQAGRCVKEFLTRRDCKHTLYT